ncbi:MAG TPA: substrate-binding domain-containing protein [Planctomycetota bacterium]|nr:substrate-binding domain-containing protein [Planctomycetota bacterium]
MGCSRDILRGVRRFNPSGAPWMLKVAWPTSTPLQVIADWKPDGVIAKLFTKEMIDALSALKVPLINVSNISGDVTFPRVAADEAALGKTAAEYFLERGFRNFAFFGYRQQRYPNDRGESFQQTVRKGGHECHTYFRATLPTLRPGGLWGDIDQRGREFLLSLPRPLAVFAYQDFLAWEVAELCHSAGLKIPEEVALLGCDNDELFCELSHPPLSSITYPAERIGYEAARMLDAFLAKSPPRQKELLLPPTGIVTRQSTDIVAIDDPDLAAAVRFIREHAAEGLAVKHILQHVAVSRRALEHKFRSVLKRSPLEEIGRVRLERAQQLLARTDLPMPEVAARAGFSNAERLSVVFRRMTGVTPSEYRRKYNAG